MKEENSERRAGERWKSLDEENTEGLRRTEKRKTNKTKETRQTSEIEKTTDRKDSIRGIETPYEKLTKQTEKEPRKTGQDKRHKQRQCENKREQNNNPSIGDDRNSRERKKRQERGNSQRETSYLMMKSLRSVSEEH